MNVLKNSKITVFLVAVTFLLLSIHGLDFLLTVSLQEPSTAILFWSFILGLGFTDIFMQARKDENQELMVTVGLIGFYTLTTVLHRIEYLPAIPDQIVGILIAIGLGAISSWFMGRYEK